MHFTISQKIPLPLHKVKSHFNRSLFAFLTKGRARIIRYDGQKAGDVIELEVAVLGKLQKWKGTILADKSTDQYYLFIDTAHQLPFPLSFWKHVHFLRKNNNESSTITDRIHFSTGKLFLDTLLFLPLFCMFYVRKWQYKKFYKLQGKENQ